MASQQPPRPWFRLASIRPPPPPAPTPSPTQQPDPVPPPPRPVIRPAFSQTFRAPLAPPQEPTPPPPPAAAAAPPRPPPVTAPTPPTIVTPERPAPPTATRAPEPVPPRSPPPPARTSPPPRASPPPPSPTAPRPPATTTTTSVPASPIIRTSAPSNMQHVSSSSVPQSPKPKVSAPPSSSSLPNSPSLKPATNGPLTSSNSSPKPKFLGRSSSSPSSPAPKVASPSPLAPPPSPYPPPPATTTTISALSSHPTSSPKAITPHANTPSSSPKISHISHPPSPLTLPPAQLKSDNEREPKIPQEAEQKTVLVQETTVKPKLTNTTSNNDQQKYVDEIRSLSIGQKANREVAKDKGNYKKNSDSEDFGMRVITIAGDNKGAIMELSPSRKNKGNPRAWSDGEKSAKGHNDYKPPTSATMNSNVQGVNNSIMFNASCTHHDPGVHLSLSRNGNGGRGIHMKERVIKD